MEYIPNATRGRALIRLFDFEREEVLRLREFVVALSSGSKTSVAFHKLPEIEAVAGCELDCRLGDRNEGVRATGPNTFECVLASSGWDNAAGLLKPFCAPDATGFQWLNEVGEISLLISCDGRW